MKCQSKLLFHCFIIISLLLFFCWRFSFFFLNPQQSYGQYICWITSFGLSFSLCLSSLRLGSCSYFCYRLKRQVWFLRFVVNLFFTLPLALPCFLFYLVILIETCACTETNIPLYVIPWTDRPHILGFSTEQALRRDFLSRFMLEDVAFQWLLPWGFSTSNGERGKSF